MHLTFFVLLISVLAACVREEKFPDIGDKIANPVDVATSRSGDYFYVLNADFDRTYNVGSIVVFDTEGHKVRSVEVPRMGRTLIVEGNDMLVLIDRQDDENGPQALLFDLSDETAPSLKRQWDMGCSPINAVMRDGYAHFAIICSNGEFFIGTLTDDRTQTKLKRTRRYRGSRRALYLDPARELIFGFYTDIDKQTKGDFIYEDVGTYDANGIEVKDGETSVQNEIPDEFENSRRDQSNKSIRQQYQFFVYDIGKERAPADCQVTKDEDCVFPIRSFDTAAVQTELRWIYFKVGNFDGTPDDDALARDSGRKYYRSNFWTARPDPDDTDVFYLSHRGTTKSRSDHANQVVRVRIVGDPRVDLKDPTNPVDEIVPRTDSFFTFERVYGFNGESNKFHYPGDIEIGYVSGYKILMVNHFRDLSNWIKDDRYFSVAAKLLDLNVWFAETTDNRDPEKRSWYQIAVNSQGRAISCSYYGNAVMLLQVTPGVAIEEISRIE